jgi:serine/threonine protein kinase
MGEVYRARDTRLGRTVAVKILPAGVAADPQLKARFEREARAIAALAHPHICMLHDVGEEDGQAFLVMEHLVGRTLADRLEEGPLSLAEALEVATEVAGALAAAHEQGVVHRDLKPGNVMLTKTGARLLDFGLAQLTAHEERSSVQSLTSAPTEQAPLTRQGMILGTMPYMAPEQVEGRPTDARSDIWALGVVLYEMLTGRRPFDGSSQARLAAAILVHEPPPLSSLDPQVPLALEHVVGRCLAKDPDARWPTARDVASALEGIPEGGPAVAPKAPAETEIKSIVVLPFQNLSPNPDQEYFSDGLTEELIADLSKVRALRVISRTSAMLLKGAKKDVPTIARDLNVRYVLEGSVRRAGDSLRITAQLIEAATDGHL